MATDKRKLTFYADQDIEDAYQEVPAFKRGAWVNEMIRKGIEATEPEGKSGPGELVELRDWLKKQPNADPDDFMGELLHVLTEFTKKKA